MLYDLFLVAIGYVYVLCVILASEFLRSRLGLGVEATRKAIHLFAGVSVVLVFWFSSVIFPLLVAGGLGLLTAYSFFFQREGVFSRTMVRRLERDKKYAYGPLYYIISIFLIVLFFWGHRNIIVASTLAMAWGDGAAAIVGGAFKKRHFYWVPLEA